MAFGIGRELEEFNMAVRKITKQLVDSSIVMNQPYFIWDTDVKGFALKVSNAGKKTYIIEYRTAGGRAGSKRTLRLDDMDHHGPQKPPAMRLGRFWAVLLMVKTLLQPNSRSSVA